MANDDMVVHLAPDAAHDVDALSKRLRLTPEETVGLAVSWYRRVGFDMILHHANLSPEALPVGHEPIGDDGYDPDYDDPNSGFYHANPDCR